MTSQIMSADHKYLSQAQFGALSKLEPSALTPTPWSPHLQEAQMINGYEINPDLDIFRQFHENVQHTSHCVQLLILMKAILLDMYWLSDVSSP